MMKMIRRGDRSERPRVGVCQGIDSLVALGVIFAMAGCGAGAPAAPELAFEGAWARPAMAEQSADGHEQMHAHDPAVPHDPMEHHPDGLIGDVPVEDHHAAMHRAGTTTAAYVVIRNEGAAADRLVGASTDVAGATELHQSRVEDGIMRMRQVEAIEVPAKGEVRLEPGGYHLMLIGPTRDLHPGDRFEATLEFEKSGTRTIEIEVRHPGG